MKFELNTDYHDKVGTVSNLHGFVHRDLDTGFSSKWSGYWTPTTKYLDYYSFKLNGVWLNKDRLEHVEYGKKMSFRYRTDVLEVKETILTDNIPGFKTKIEIKNPTDQKRAANLSVEVGVDIRPRDEDIGAENYEIEEKKDALEVKKEVRGNEKKLKITSDNNFHRDGFEHVKEHFPSERQKCLIPGEIVFQEKIEPGSTKEIEIEFRTAEEDIEELEIAGSRLEGDLSHLFGCSINSLENLVYNRKGKGIIAGHPWFQNYWARDSFWSVLGLIDSGYFELSEEILENFAERNIPGKIEIEGEDNHDMRADTLPLFIIASESLKQKWKLSEKLENACQKAMNGLEVEDNIVKHEPAGTWMDTLERGKAVDIQSLWLEAAKIRDSEKQKSLRKGLDRFVEEERIKDSLENDSEAINPVIPLLFKHFNHDTALKELERINGEFSSRYGARTRSITDPGYEPSGYHNGSVWGLTTGWAAAANFTYGKGHQGLSMLEKMTQFLNRNQLGALPEVVDAENGRLLGCPEQAWSAGMALWVIDSYLLGISVEENKVKVNPKSNISCRRIGKRVKDSYIDLKIENGEAELLNDPEIDVML